MDQMGQTITLNSNPMRIVSLVPSQTELLFDLGLGDRVIGITKFCIHPKEWFDSKKRIGGTKSVNFDTISELQPDLIIGNKEENKAEDIERLSLNYPVWMSDIKTLDQAIDMIYSLGQMVHVERKANEIVQAIKTEFTTIPLSSPLKSALYLIWKDPYMAAGRDTFINEMLFRNGLENAITEIESRYPSLELKDIQELNPDVILLSSEPYPFKQIHLEEIAADLAQSNIQLVDGEMFSWYGSRLKLAPRYFKQIQRILHSEY